MSSSQRSLHAHELITPGKQSLSLQRAKSQFTQPVYVSSFRNTLGDDLDQSKDLGTSKASQFTFSKPSEFIINTPKQNIYLEAHKKKVLAAPSIPSDYFCGTFGNNFHSFNPKMKDSYFSINESSPMKQSYQSQTLNSSKNSIVICHSPKIVSSPQKIVPVFRKENQSPMVRSSIFHPQKLPSPLLVKNSSSGFSIRPSLRRCLSNVSIISQKSIGKLSQTKIKFNYISPPKSEMKTPRKISFKNQDVRNPLSKLSKKKEQKTKVQPIMKQKNNFQIVNQYFPGAKIKKNKMKSRTSPQPKQLKVQISALTKNEDQSDVSDKSQRSKTFIASLAALASLSDIKQAEKDVSTKILPETQNRVSQPACEYLSLESNPKIEGKSIKYNKIAGYRITLDGQKIPLYSPKKEEAVSSLRGSQVSKEVALKESRVSKQAYKESAYKDSQVSSVNSIKNGVGQEFEKKFGNDSSHTTDYEDEISKKIKQDLGLHFSYFKKK